MWLYKSKLTRTSHQRTTSEKKTKAPLPKCPLFGGSTVLYTFESGHTVGQTHGVQIRGNSITACIINI